MRPPHSHTCPERSRRAPTLIFFSLSVIITLSSCGGDQATPSSPPAVTIIAPAAGTPLPSVGVTIVPPSAAPDQPTAAPEQVIGPETYPPGINPLTGLAIDPALANRRPLAIKISNFPRYVRPQFGLSLADVVFEHYAEGGTSRFTAVFYGSDADKVGPIRSARLIDTIIPEMFKAALVASGSSTGVVQRLSYKDWFDVIVSERTGYACPPLCRETEDTNSLYSSTAAIHQALRDKGIDDSVQPQRGVAFLNAPPAGGVPGTTIRVDFSGEAHSEWRYNAVSGKYERWSDTSATEMQAHFDALTHQPIETANVIVLFVNHVVDFSIPEDFDTDGFTGHFSTEIQLWSTGPAWLFRDGQAYLATWVRLDKGDMVGLVDSQNHIIPLKPGNTWYEVLGLHSDQSNSGADWYARHKSPVDKGEIPGVPTPTPTLEGATAEVPTETPTATP